MCEGDRDYAKEMKIKGMRENETWLDRRVLLSKSKCL